MRWCVQAAVSERKRLRWKLRRVLCHRHRIDLRLFSASSRIQLCLGAYIGKQAPMNTFTRYRKTITVHELKTNLDRTFSITLFHYIIRPLSLQQPYRLLRPIQPALPHPSQLCLSSDSAAFFFTNSCAILQSLHTCVTPSPSPTSLDSRTSSGSSVKSAAQRIVWRR